MGKAMKHSDLSPAVEAVAHSVIGCAIEVHRTLGPGFIERLYEDAFMYELGKAGLAARRQVDIVVPYKEIALEGQRLDLIVEDVVIVELKAVSAVTELHTAQLLSYMRAINKPLRLLFNFHTTVLKDSMKRLINDRWNPASSPTNRLAPAVPSCSSSPSR